MKKIAAVLITMLILFFMSGSEAEAAEYEVNAGDVVNISLVIPGEGYDTVKATVNTDSDNVMLSGISAGKTEWVAEKYGNNIVFYDNSGANPLKDGETAAVLSFRLNDDMAAGTKSTVSINDITCYAGETEYVKNSVEYTLFIKEEHTGDAALVGISVKGFTLVPEFNPDITEYSIGSVSYETEYIDITANPSHYKADVAITGNNLIPGENRILISVTADNGNVKEYTVKVTRNEKKETPGSTPYESEKNTESGSASEKYTGSIQDTDSDTEYNINTEPEETQYSETETSALDSDKQTVPEDIIIDIGEVSNDNEVMGYVKWIIIAVCTVAVITAVVVIRKKY